MADGQDTDRMAGDLMKALLGSLNKPVAGTGQTGPTPQVDEKSMMDTIKGFLNQSLPGTKEREKPSAPAVPLGTPYVSQYPQSVSGTHEVDWESMYRRQEREREAMYGRQLTEREGMQQRHKKEMETLAGIGQERDTQVARPVVRPHVTRPRPVLGSRAAGIVPGKTIGNWMVQTENGPKTFTAVSEEQAFREARRYGLTPTSAQLTGIHAYTPEQLEQMLSSFGMPGKRESMEAEFEQAIKLGLIPETSVFERLPDREWGYRVSKDAIVRKGSALVRRRGF